MGIFLAWLIFSIVPALVASSNNRSAVAWFFISLLISPLLALIALIAVGKKEGGSSSRRNYSQDAYLDMLKSDGGIVAMIILAVTIGWFLFG